MTTIYVGNLDPEVNERDLRGIFEGFGTVSSVKIIMDKYSGKSKGYGFVTMPSEWEAAKAIYEVNGANLNNKTIVVNEAKSKRINN